MSPRPRSAPASVAARIPDALPALALLAALLGLLVPARGAADAVDALLAALVLATALDIEPRRLVQVRARWRMVLGLALGSLLALGAAAWALSRLLAGEARTGVLALGLSPAEVASVGLIGLMAGPAEVAVAVLAASLVLSAVLAPPLLGVLATGGHGVDVAALLSRFALVVLVPLAAGIAARAASPRTARAGPWPAAAASLVVAALVYVSLSAAGTAGLSTALAAAAGFLALSAALALVVARLARGLPSTLALTVGMRDFAVAAALAGAAGGSAAARLAGVYGVLMLIAGAGVAGLARRR